MKYKWKDTDQYTTLYKQKPSYDAASNRHLDTVLSLLTEQKIKSVLDFGCGKNNMLVKGLIEKCPNISIVGYDPAVEDSECTSTLTNQISENVQIDFIVSTDCLEHVPKDELLQCWEIFRMLRPKIMYHGICTRVAKQILPDGTNAHKTIELGDWWKNELEREFLNFSFLKANIQPQYSTFLLKNNIY